MAHGDSAAPGRICEDGYACLAPDCPCEDRPAAAPVYSQEFRDWLVMGKPGSVQRERYDRAVEAWNSGATEDEVAEIMGVRRAES